MTAFRLPDGGRIDSSQKLRFLFDGRRLVGFLGDTPASALLANDVFLVGRSLKYHHRHCDVLVVGGGRSGCRAAVEAARDGKRVVLCDEGAVEAMPGVSVLSRTTVFGYYDDNFLCAVESDARRQRRLWHFRAKQVVLATGAHERPLVFGGNDRPGVMLASAVDTYLRRYAVAPGKRVVVFTNNDGGHQRAKTF